MQHPLTIQDKFGDEQYFFSMIEQLAIRQVITKCVWEKTSKFGVHGLKTPWTLIPMITCGQSSRGSWTNKNLQTWMKLQALTMQERATINQDNNVDPSFEK